MTASTEAQRRIRVRWLPVAITFGFGLLLTVLPFWLEDRWGWAGAAPSTMTNVGTTLLLAAALFFVERAFLAEVRSVATKAASGVVAEATADLRASNEALAAEVRDLQERTTARVSARTSAQDRALQQVGEIASYDAVAQALALAHQYQAVYRPGPIVRASTKTRGPRLRFAWGSYEPSDDYYGGGRAGSKPDLIVSLAVTQWYEDEELVPDVVWPRGMSPDEFFSELVSHMQAHGNAAQANDLDAAVAMEELSESLRVAMAARRRDGDVSLVGQVIEVLDDGVVITNRGVERLTSGVVVPESEFPPGGKFSTDGRRTMSDQELFSSRRPDDVDADRWAVAVARARTLFPFPVPSAYAPRPPVWRPGREYVPR